MESGFLQPDALDRFPRKTGFPRTLGMKDTTCTKVTIHTHTHNMYMHTDTKAQTNLPHIHTQMAKCTTATFASFVH